MSTTTSDQYQFITEKIHDCINDLKRITPKNLNLTTPFYYLPSSTGLELLGQNSLNNSFRKTRALTKLSPYYSNCRESSDRLFSELTNNEDNNDERISGFAYTHRGGGGTSSYQYYQNCIIEFVLRLFGGSHSRTGNFNERLSLVRLLLELAPTNGELVKQFTWLSHKVNGLQKTVQLLYDHLSINTIDNEHLWIL